MLGRMRFRLHIDVRDPVLGSGSFRARRSVDYLAALGWTGSLLSLSSLATRINVGHLCTIRWCVVAVNEVKRCRRHLLPKVQNSHDDGNR